MAGGAAGYRTGAGGAEATKSDYLNKECTMSYRFVLFGLAASALSGAHAAAPQVKTQAPGYYRMMLGDFEVTALSDGTMDLPVDKLLTNVQPAEVAALLKRQFLKSPMETSVNGFLINTGTKLVLVDTGAGTMFGP